jgi:hypothetical protein
MKAYITAVYRTADKWEKNIFVILPCSSLNIPPLLTLLIGEINETVYQAA